MPMRPGWMAALLIPVLVGPASIEEPPRWTRSWGSTGSENGQLRGPYGIAVVQLRLMVGQRDPIGLCASDPES